MKKRDFETYQKRFRDFEILPKFSETHVFRGTIRHPLERKPCEGLSNVDILVSLRTGPFLINSLCRSLFTKK